MAYDESLEFLDLESLEYCHPHDCGTKYETENSPQQETIYPPQQEKKGIVYALKIAEKTSPLLHPLLTLYEGEAQLATPTVCAQPSLR
ncbi:hypothetical protein Syun_011254 [Stephania yunnanensis]|uniref:Uncharacterized protein n=1 Tax=Stephania yunnanensis TaxID=152371 RepID=A0AAP0JXX3_9MAGN